jgi:hypothetical protein
MNRLNGWQRLFVVTSYVWLAFVCIVAIIAWQDFSDWTLKGIGIVFLVWLIPSFVVYGLGLAVVWITEGFRQAQ